MGVSAVTSVGKVLAEWAGGPGFSHQPPNERRINKKIHKRSKLGIKSIYYLYCGRSPLEITKPWGQDDGLYHVEVVDQMARSVLHNDSHSGGL